MWGAKKRERGEALPNDGRQERQGSDLGVKRNDGVSDESQWAISLDVKRSACKLTERW